MTGLKSFDTGHICQHCFSQYWPKVKEQKYCSWDCKVDAMWCRKKKRLGREQVRHAMLGSTKAMQKK